MITFSSIGNLKHHQMYLVLNCETWCCDQVPLLKENWGNIHCLISASSFLIHGFCNDFPCVLFLKKLFFKIYYSLLFDWNPPKSVYHDMFFIKSFLVNSISFSHSEPNIANTCWRRNRKKAIAEQRTASSRFFLIPLSWIDSFFFLKKFL